MIAKSRRTTKPKTMYFRVRYTVGKHSDIRRVKAEDSEDAITKMKKWVKKEFAPGDELEQSYSIVDDNEHIFEHEED